jgi:DNA-binding transcriptional LysR family regulator
MELMQLEMFVAVFEERSVRRAAERVRRTQPVVSLALGKLEWKIGLRLMERRRGDYRLTDAGKVLYEYASRIIALRNEALSQFGGTTTVRAGRLCVGIGIVEPALWLSQLASTFGKKFPNVRFEVLRDRSEVLASDLVGRRIDLAFLPAPPEPNRTNSDLATVAIFVPGGESGQVQPAWVVQHRMGCSYMAKAFEDMAISFSKDCMGAAHQQATPAKPRLSTLIRRAQESTVKTAAITSSQVRAQPWTRLSTLCR